MQFTPVAMKQLLIASTAVKTIGTLMGASATAQDLQNRAAASRYNAQVQENEALIADMNMRAAGEQAARKEEMQRRQIAMRHGMARAGLAQSGTALGSGSNLDIIRQSEIANELDALTIRYEGALDSASFFNQGQNLRSRAQLSSMDAAKYNEAARSTRMSGLVGAGAEILGGYKEIHPYLDRPKTQATKGLAAEEMAHRRLWQRRRRLRPQGGK